MDPDELKNTENFEGTEDGSLAREQGNLEILDPRQIENGTSTEDDAWSRLGIPVTKLKKNLALSKSNNNVVLISTGAYCPIHLMHTDIFEKAKKHLEMNFGYKVVAGYISPTHDNYVSYKVETDQVKSIPGIQRLDMVRKAVANSNWLDASDWEVQQDGFVDFPQVWMYFKEKLESSFKVNVKYLCGADHAIKCNLPRSNMQCVAIARPGFKIPKGQYKSFIFIQEETLSISSTQIRNLMYNGESLFGLVDPSVEAYITDNNVQIKR